VTASWSATVGKRGTASGTGPVGAPLWPRLSIATISAAGLTGRSSPPDWVLWNVPSANRGESPAASAISAREAPSAVGIPHAARASRPIPAVVAPTTVARSTEAVSERTARA
jgi:hypothetical protein